MKRHIILILNSLNFRYVPWSCLVGFVSTVKPPSESNPVMRLQNSGYCFKHVLMVLMTLVGLAADSLSFLIVSAYCFSFFGSFLSLSTTLVAKFLITRFLEAMLWGMLVCGKAAKSVVLMGIVWNLFGFVLQSCVYSKRFRYWSIEFLLRPILKHYLSANTPLLTSKQ